MKSIIACDPRGGIGYKNQLPWDKLDGDLARFKELTMGGTVIMGRNTWDSLPKRPLPNRTNVIITSTPPSGLIDGCIFTNDIGAFEDDNNAWIIGGAYLINSMWAKTDEIHLSRAYANYQCDVFIQLVLLESEFRLDYVKYNTDHSYEIWQRE